MSASKIQSNIKAIGEKHGIKSSYGLQKFLDIAPSVAVRLWNDEVTRFSVEILENLCEKFACDVGDLLCYPPYVPATGKPEPERESVAVESVKVKAEKPAREPVTAKAERIVEPLDIDGGDYTLTFAEVVERLGKKDSSVRRYLKSNRLRGEKIKQEWQIWASDLMEFENSDWFRNLK